MNLESKFKEPIMNNRDSSPSYQKLPQLVKKNLCLIENEESIEFKSKSIMNKLKLNEKSVRCKFIH